MTAHTNIPMTVLNTSNERIEANGFMCDCATEIVTININEDYTGDHIVSIAFKKDDLKRMVNS